MMSNTKLARIIFLLLFLISIIYPLFILNELPQRMASHFGFDNKADGWMSKSGFLFFHYGLVVFFFLIFYGLGFAIPKFPKSLINLPQKDYWLEEGRKERAYALLRAMLFWIGSLCLLLFLYVDFEVYRANINGSERLSNYSWVSVLIFLSATMFVVIKYIMFFTKKENQLDDK